MQVVVKPNPKNTTDPALQKEAEGERVAKLIAAGSRVVMLDERGKDLSSEGERCEMHSSPARVRQWRRYITQEHASSERAYGRCQVSRTSLRKPATTAFPSCLSSAGPLATGRRRVRGGKRRRSS